MTESKIFRYFAMVVLALEQTHEQEMFHQNISSAHIYIQDEGDVAKVANHANPSSLARYHQHPGEWYYLPPECMKHLHVEKKEHTEKQDVFSLGMLLLEMLSGQKPHFDRSDRRS